MRVARTSDAALSHTEGLSLDEMHGCPKDVIHTLLTPGMPCGRKLDVAWSVIAER